MSGSYGAAVRAFMDTSEGGAAGWAALSFFRTGAAHATAARIDARVAGGAQVLPPPEDVLAALRLTPPDQVRVVILGQDPYPTPGDAHGLAFSVRDGVAVPRSLRNILKELAADIGSGVPGPSPWDKSRGGSLLPWARQGVLLLNTCLTVEAGAAGTHRGLGWEKLADDVIRHVSDHPSGSVFLLWGADAQKRLPLIDTARHLVLATAHPSPLSARRGFFGSRPFSRSNAWLRERGRGTIDWLV